MIYGKARSRIQLLDPMLELYIVSCSCSSCMHNKRTYFEKTEKKEK